MRMTPKTEQRAAATASDARWTAVLTRNQQADGTFVYAVITTGVFCRPSCAARHARPENVRFFATPSEAQQAGFRACKRCRPADSSAAAATTAAMAELCQVIESSDPCPPLHALARHAGLSPFHLHRTFKSVVGLTPHAYAAAHRARRMRASLASGASVTSAIYNAGFSTSSRFYESADKVLGMTPSTFRNGGANIAIHFAMAACSLGSVLVAQSERGLCAVLLGDDPPALVEDLARRFPKADLRPADGAFQTVVAQVVASIEQPALALDLPLDIRGTAFQQRVWKALQALPAGTTTSYTALAESIGSPSAVRAVAQACAANAHAVLIPCHRVVRSDGTLSGYRWGLHRKQALLTREARTPAVPPVANP